MASTSTSDVVAKKNTAPGTDDADAGQPIDWEEARRDANKAIARLGVAPQKPADRTLLIKAAALKQRLSENWFWGALDSTAERYSKPDRPKVTRWGYLHAALSERCRELQVGNFNFLLKGVRVPGEVLATAQPPPRQA